MFCHHVQYSLTSVQNFGQENILIFIKKDLKKLFFVSLNPYLSKQQYFVVSGESGH